VTAPRLTASALPRAFACTGSLVLPQARTASVWADAGTERHDEQEDAIDAGDLSAMPDKVRALIPDGAELRAEVAVAYDVATGYGRELGVGLGRAYSGLGPFEIAGTIDAIAIVRDASGRAVRVLIIDWKGYEDVGDPARNEQVALYALASARAHGVDEVDVVIAYLGTGRVENVTLDVFEIDSFGERLRGLHLAVASQQSVVASGRLPDVSESRHCKHCPAIHSCPAKIALLRRLVSGQESDEMEMLIPLDEDSARMALERLAAAKSLLRRIDAAVYAYAANAERPIPLGEGRYFGRHSKMGNERLDGDKVWQVVTEMHGRDVADQVVERHATKAKIKETLKGLAKAGLLPAGATQASEERRILAGVRARGGATREEKESIGEFAVDEATPINAPRALKATG